jgi:hypothetical protein
LSCDLQMWENIAPSKKAYRRTHRARTLDDHQQLMEQAVLELYANLRLALKTTTDATFDALQRLVLLV